MGSFVVGDEVSMNIKQNRKGVTLILPENMSSELVPVIASDFEGTVNLKQIEMITNKL